MGLFDERNLFEVTHPDFPGERLIACCNPELAKLRAAKRKSLIEATRAEVEKVRRMVERGRLHGREKIEELVHKVLGKYSVGKHYQVHTRDDGFDVVVDENEIAAEIACMEINNPDRAQAGRERYERHRKAIAEQFEKLRQRIHHGRLHGKDVIGIRVGRVINKHKVGKHFKLDIHDDRFSFEIDQEKVAQEAALDGIYVVRTGLEPNEMSTDDAVRSYKLLSHVERAWRSFKTIDLKVRPIHHWLENRVRAHILLCMLAYYIQWHMQEAWRPLLFSDEDQNAKATRDPVAPAKRSKAADRKADTKTLEDGSKAHSFRTLLKLLSSIVKNICRLPKAGKDAPTFEIITTPSAQQERAYSLLKAIKV